MQSSYVTELSAWVDGLEAGELTEFDKEVLKGVRKNLYDARIAAARGFWSAEERVHTNICAAESGLLRVVPVDKLPGWLPTVQQAVSTHLPKDDSVRMAVERFIAEDQNLAQQASQQQAWGWRPFARDRRVDAVAAQTLAGENRELLVKGLQAAYYADAIEKRRASSFRNVVYAGTGVLALLATGLVFTTVGDQPLVNLCFPEPHPRACPTGYLAKTPAAAGGVTVIATAKTTVKAVAHSDPDPGTATGTAITSVVATAVATPAPTMQGTPPDPEDLAGRPVDQEGLDIVTVEIFGLMAAALTAAVAVRKMSRKRPPYSVPLALALLKLPAGAVSAVLGVTLINAGLIPGLDKLETPNQILAWAALFGAGQQALTQFVDNKALEVLRTPGSEED